MRAKRASILLGLRARTNKAKLSDAEGKIRGARKYISSNSVIPCSLASTMYIYVELTILYIFVSKKMQICVFKSLFGVCLICPSVQEIVSTVCICLPFVFYFMLCLIPVVFIIIIEAYMFCRCRNTRISNKIMGFAFLLECIVYAPFAVLITFFLAWRPI